MRAADLHRLARRLREVALLATGNTGAEAVTGGQLAVVEDLARHPGSTVGEITARTGLAQSLVSRIIAAMVEAGVVTTEDDPADRRRRRLALDASANALIRRRGDRSAADAVAAAMPASSADERAEALRLLARLAELLDRPAPR